MRQGSAIPLLLVVVLASCEQAAQELPFAPTGQATEKTVAAGGGTISTAAGASVAFPAGSVAQTTAVTLTSVAAPAAAQRGGVSASSAFQLEPAGMVLDKPASVSLKFDPTRDAQRAWLATVVNVVPGSVQELGTSRVDFTTSLVDAKISTLGTVSVVIPEENAVVVVGLAAPSRSPAPPSISTTTAVAPTRAMTMACGGIDNRCKGLSVTVSNNLLEKVARAAAIYPQIDTNLRFAGGRASGHISLTTVLRAQLKSERTAENVTVRVTIEPTATTVVKETATSIHLSDMRFRISGAIGVEEEAEERITSLEIPKPGTTGLVTVDRTFNFRSKSGDEMEPASIRVTFPVKLQN